MANNVHNTPNPNRQLGDAVVEMWNLRVKSRNAATQFVKDKYLQELEDLYQASDVMDCRAFNTLVRSTEVWPRS